MTKDKTLINALLKKVSTKQIINSLMLGSDGDHHTVKGLIEGIPDIVKKNGKDETFKVNHYY